MTVTLSDIAAACGTSASTVSRALSQPDKVNAATRAHIQQVARQMGYNPNQAARSLSLGRTGMIAVIVPDIANPFFPPIIKAIQARAGRHGYAVLLTDTEEHVPDELSRASSLRRQVDGLIVVSPRTPSDKLPSFLELEPIVFVNREVPHGACVLTENGEGIRQAVEHLAALGHRTICYLGGPRRSWSNQQRKASIADACAAFGVEFVELGPFEPQVEAGVRAGDLVQASGVTAVIAYDDLIALGVMARLAERGQRVGADVSVIGIDDSPMSGVAYPTLTSIHVPGAEAGTAAVDLLLDILADPSAAVPPPVQMDTRLIIRSSTGWARPAGGLSSAVKDLGS